MRTRLVLFFLLTILVLPNAVSAFSVLSHQAVVDGAWESSVAPEIRRRFPGTTREQLEKAHAFAYGGAHIADLGYFPLGDQEFTDLLHYVRTGDFLDALLASAKSADEYAFALGAVAHYIGDTVGHPEATNRAVPIIYPALRKKYGDSVTYAQDHSSHLQTEFRFDVYEMSRDKRSRDLFKHTLGFEVSERVLDEAFHKTYALHLDDLFESTDVAILTYRYGFRALIHEATGIAWELYRADIQTLDPAVTPESFIFDVSRADFEQEFGKSFREPGYFAKFVAFFVKLVPNWGPFKRSIYKPLPPRAQELFTRGVEHSIARYRAAITRIREHDELANKNLDTGEPPPTAGKYEPADVAYAALVDELATRNFANVPPPLRADILRFYGGTSALTVPTHGKSPCARAKAKKLREELHQLAAQSSHR